MLNVDSVLSKSIFITKFTQKQLLVQCIKIRFYNRSELNVEMWFEAHIHIYTCHIVSIYQFSSRINVFSLCFVFMELFLLKTWQTDKLTKWQLVCCSPQYSPLAFVEIFIIRIKTPDFIGLFINSKKYLTNSLKFRIIFAPGIVNYNLQE